MMEGRRTAIDRGTVGEYVKNVYPTNAIRYQDASQSRMQPEPAVYFPVLSRRTNMHRDIGGYNCRRLTPHPHWPVAVFSR